MKKFLSIFAALLVAVAVFADTDFAAPGYYCAADDAVLTGGSGSNFTLNTELDPHQIQWSDVGLSSNALATWTITATRGCYVTVSLDLGPVIASNKHIFEVKILDDKSNVKGTLAEPAENADADQVKVLDGTILLPLPGTYTVELRNNRDWGKGRIKNVILTYAADAPSEIVDVTSVELNKAELALQLEEVEQLFATVLPEDATDPSVTWESSDKEIATVSEDGLVTAVAEGTATIKAKAGEKEATCAVTVAAVAIPDVNFAAPYVLSAKKAQLEGAIWKMYKDDTYKLYGEGGHNKQYGNAIWTVNVTKTCILSGVLNGVEGGHLFELDLYKGEEFVATIAHPAGKAWSAGEIDLEGTFTIAEAGNYTFKLRNTQEWSSGKVAGITLTDVTPAETKYYLKNNWDGASEWTWKEMSPMDKGSGTYYILDSVVFGGTGVNVNTEIMDETATWIPMESFVDMDEEDGLTIGALDTVVFFYVPSQSASISYNIIGKYVDPISEHTYTVAGSSDVVFGTSWDPTNSANDMIKQEDGTYKWEKTELTLPKCAIQFKVCKDHAWTTAYPASDYELAIPEGGIYTITITFNADTKEVNAIATKTGDAQVDPVVSIAGSMNSWNASADVMILSDDKATASLSLNLTATTYEFKVVLNGSEWRSNAHEFTRESATASGMTGNLDNMKLIADVEGAYVFTWTFATNTLTIAFPAGSAIDNTNAESKIEKFFRDGQLIIRKNGVEYNAQGAIVK